MIKRKKSIDKIVRKEMYKFHFSRNLLAVFFIFAAISLTLTSFVIPNKNVEQFSPINEEGVNHGNDLEERMITNDNQKIIVVCNYNKFCDNSETKMTCPSDCKRSFIETSFIIIIFIVCIIVIGIFSIVKDFLEKNEIF
jgi:quinol-cytochrome oxidoreductase complex cytochrome b subunit